MNGAENVISWAAGASAAAKHHAAAQQKAAQQRLATSHSRQTTPASGSQSTPSQLARPVNPPAVSGYVTPSGDPVPGNWGDQAASFASGVGTPYLWSGGQSCDQNIFAGDATSCALANNMFMVVAAASHYSNVIPGSISVFDPDTGVTQVVTCTEYAGTDNQTDLQCLTASGSGTAFPVWAANAYYQ